MKRADKEAIIETLLEYRNRIELIKRHRQLTPAEQQEQENADKQLGEIACIQPED